MHIKQIEYTRLVNLGNYEHRRLTATAILTDQEDPDDAARKLRQFVEDNATEGEYGETT